MRLNNKSGFTLMELVMVIVILGILAVVAVPQFQNINAEANLAAEEGVVGGVRAGIAGAFAASAANPKVYPAALGGAADGPCTAANACFDTVLAQGGITKGWSKAALVYTGPAAGTYTYVPATGDFN